MKQRTYFLACALLTLSAMAVLTGCQSDSATPTATSATPTTSKATSGKLPTGADKTLSDPKVPPYAKDYIKSHAPAK